MPFSEQAGSCELSHEHLSQVQETHPSIRPRRTAGCHDRPVRDRVWGLLTQIPEKPGQISIDSASGDNPTAGLETPDGVPSGPVEEVPGRQAETCRERETSCPRVTRSDFTDVPLWCEPAAAASVSSRIVATSGVTSSVTAILCLLHSPAISRATSRVYCQAGSPASAGPRSHRGRSRRCRSL